jgi:hypothetical protein
MAGGTRSRRAHQAKNRGSAASSSRTADKPPAPGPGGHGSIEQPEHRGQTQRGIGLGLGGLGVAGIAFGAFAGIEAMSTYADAKNACGGTVPQCSAGSSAFGLHDRTVTWATASTIAFAAGGAVLAAGAVVFFSAPKDESGPSLGVTPTAQGATVSLRGTF